MVDPPRSGRSPTQGHWRSKSSQFKSIFGYNQVSVSFALSFVYLVVIVSVALFQADPSYSIHTPSGIPATYPEKYTQDAWSDLQRISRSPHSYGNRENDQIWLYLNHTITNAISSSRSIGAQIDCNIQRVFVDKDVSSLPRPGPVYYEANNILVKVPGADPNISDVLISAHFDSVPTGKGTTDDGMGIASMLAVLRYLLDRDHPPLRTVIFNFNNNEEFGLLGAEAFLFHPWSRTVGAFLNLEGAGAGGRPVLFRGTDLGMVKHFAAASNPHGSSLLQQGFESGLVHSDTDYTIYTKKANMRGLDLAFYKPRALYHTRRDNIQSSSISSLGLMFTNALDIIRSLSSYPYDEFPFHDQAPVYFDLFGRYFFAFALRKLLWFNILSLIVGPPIAWLAVKRSLPPHSSISLRSISISGYPRSILALLVSLLASFFFVMALNRVNPFLLVSRFYAPLLTVASFFIICNFIILVIANRIKPVLNQKRDMFVVLFALLWIVLLASTISIWRTRAVGTYAVTIIYLGAFVGVLFSSWSTPALIVDVDDEPPLSPLSDDEEEEEEEHEPEGDQQAAQGQEQGRQQREAQQQGQQQQQQQDRSRNDGDHRANETTRLLPHISQRRAPAYTRHLDSSSVSETETVYMTVRQTAMSQYLWLLEFVLVVPLTLILTSTTVLLALDSMHQSAVDSATAESTLLLFEAVALCAVTIAIFATPFSHSLHRVLASSLIILTIIGSYTLFTAHPFTEGNPLKLRFTQIVDIAAGSPPVVNVLGTPKSTMERILTDLPSVKEANATVDCQRSDPPSTVTCKYASGLRPFVGGTWNYSEWMGVDLDYDSEAIHSNAPNKATITITANNTRRCDVKFWSVDGTPKLSNAVKTISVINGHEEFVSIRQRDGFESVQLHKLDWSSPYKFSIEWVPQWRETTGGYENGLGLEINCMYADYDQEILVHYDDDDDDDNDNHDNDSHGSDVLRRKVPALDEVLEYSPSWVTWVNWGPGLVQARRYLQI